MSMKTKTVIVRVTPEQHELIRNKAHSKGYTTIASYVLAQVLERDLVFEQKFEELYKIVIRKLK